MAGEATKEMAERAIRRLKSAGYEALLAGGCVRDMLLGHRPKDYDVATSATPQEVKRLFRRVLMVGAKFGVAMVIEQRRRLEVTTFRCDLSYTDGRRPNGVRFVTAREDAVRRDFTINGMFYDVTEGKVVDYVGGQDDLKARVIRAIGDPQQRFSEDYLRMLRAARFAVRLGFDLEPATVAAIRLQAPKITHISGERIHDELAKMLTPATAPAALQLLHELGLLRQVLPELYRRDGLYPRALRRLSHVARRQDMLLAFAALLCELPAAEIDALTRRWGAGNQFRNALVWMSAHLNDWQTLPEAPLAELKRLLAHRQFRRLELLWRLEELEATGSVHKTRAIHRRAAAIDPAKITPKYFVRGPDLKKLGLEEGPLLGRIIAEVYEAQLNEQVNTSREALRLARQLVQTRKTEG